MLNAKQFDWPNKFAKQNTRSVCQTKAMYLPKGAGQTKFVCRTKIISAKQNKGLPNKVSICQTSCVLPKSLSNILAFNMTRSNDLSNCLNFFPGVWTHAHDTHIPTCAQGFGKAHAHTLTTHSQTQDEKNTILHLTRTLSTALATFGGTSHPTQPYTSHDRARHTPPPALPQPQRPLPAVPRCGGHVPPRTHP